MSHTRVKGTLRVTNKTPKSAEMSIYGPIGKDWYGDGVSAASFAKELKAIGNVGTINLRINSEGGVVTEARAMYNQLIQHSATVNIHIDGIAASAASFLAMAGDHITIAEGAFFMIHNARAVAIGGAEDMRKMADVLELVNETIRDTYTARTGVDYKKVKSWMDAETWFNGNQAVENGFADEVIKNYERVAACVDSMPPWFNTMPEIVRPNRAKVLALMGRSV